MTPPADTGRPDLVLEIYGQVMPRLVDEAGQDRSPHRLVGFHLDWSAPWSERRLVGDEGFDDAEFEPVLASNGEAGGLHVP